MRAAWMEEQLDPDNWLTIPDLGVNPAEVNFVGFADPIVHPGSRDLWLATQVRALVRSARKLLLKSFSSLDEVATAAAGAVQKVHNPIQRDSSVITNADSPLEASKGRAALYFSLFMRDVQSALQEKRAKWAARHFAEAAQSLLAWSLDEVDGTTLQRALAAREANAAGGKKGAATRQKTALDPVKVLEAARAEGWPEVRYGLRKKLAARFNVHPDHIGRILNSDMK